MADYSESFFRSFTAEVNATIGRIDELIGNAHWLSVGNYKEGVIRRQLVDYLPERYSVGTGFVLQDDFGKRVLSRQIDVLIWDSHNYSPVFRDGSFVVIPPAALRVAMEIKGNLRPDELSTAMENLDSLTPFIPLLANHHDDDPEAKIGFRRYIVAVQSPLTFPDSIFTRLHKYYITRRPTETREEFTVAQRLGLTMASGWGLTPWFSGIAILNVGMIQAVPLPDRIGYFVCNDVKADGVDHTIGLVRKNVEWFLTNSRIRKHMQDYAVVFHSPNRTLLPVPFTTDVEWKGQVFQLPETPIWKPPSGENAADGQND